MYIIILVYHTENRHRHRMDFTNLYIATNVFSWANHQLCKNNFETHSYLKYRYITTHK